MGSTGLQRGLVLKFSAFILVAVNVMANQYNNWGWGGGGGGGGGGSPGRWWGGGFFPGSKKIVVGGDAKWRFGYNYPAWACNNTPFYQYDTLVFKYPPPNVGAGIFPHDVYLLRSYQSYLNCNFSGAVKVAGNTSGGGDGFEFVLTALVPHYFACSTRDGFHCRNGTMKFFVLPWLRFWQ